MKPPILNITTPLLLLLVLLGTSLTIFTLAHPVHSHHHLISRERVPFWNDPEWGTRAPETPRPMTTVMPSKPISSPSVPPTMPGVALPKPIDTSEVALPAPTPAIAPLNPGASNPAPSPSSFRGSVVSNPASFTPAIAEKSCLDLSLWATANGPSPMMSVAGSLSKNNRPVCSIWALVDQASPRPVELSCKKGHEASFRFDNGGGLYKGGGRPVSFDVIRNDEAKVDGKEAWSWVVRGCWDESVGQGTRGNLREMVTKQ